MRRCDLCGERNAGTAAMYGLWLCGRASCLTTGLAYSLGAVPLEEAVKRARVARRQHTFLREARRGLAGLAIVASLAAIAVGAPAQASNPNPKPKPWTIAIVVDKDEGLNYTAIYTTRKNAVLTGALLAKRGTWRDVRRLFNASFVEDVRYAPGGIRRLGRVILRVAARGKWVVYRSENGGYPFAPFVPEPSQIRPVTLPKED